MDTQILEIKNQIKKQFKMKTNLTAELVLVTPELAKNYLRFNLKNRKRSEKHILFLSKEMRKGNFLENGEAIIFDKYGTLKDGQHRLLAIIRSGKSYHIPIVRGVDADAMATYDTGKNRSASDVLSLNGYKNSNAISSLIKGVYKYDNKKSKGNFGSNNHKSETLTNMEVLEYCKNNYEWLWNYVNKTMAFNANEKLKVLTATQMGIIAYLIGGEYPDNEVWDFIKHLVGKKRETSTSSNYVFTKLYNAKINKDKLNFYWILGVSLKAWNLYIDGNPSVNYLKFTIDQELPKVNKLKN